MGDTDRSWWSHWYGLALMTTAYIVGEVAHFLINTTGRDLAREIHFGDQACFVNESLPTSIQGSGNCSQKTEEECSSLSGCYWDYNGLGNQYQVLAGPAFVAVFSVSAVLLAVMADRLRYMVSRTQVLGLGILLFSLGCLGMGLATQYWHLVVLRMCIAAGESVCRPMGGSLLADMFPPQTRGVANGIFSWGVYWGYGLAFVLGINVTQADVFGFSWRAPYVMASIPGVIIALLVILTLKDPQRRDEVTPSTPPPSPSSPSSPPTSLPTPTSSPPPPLLPESRTRSGYLSQLWSSVSPALLLLLLAAMARHTAGYSWAYNTRPFFQLYHPDFNIGYWILAASIVGGSFGVFAGGYFSDKLVTRLGLHSRLWLLSVCTLLACPLAVATLTISPPASMASLIGYYFFAETWFAVLFTVIVEVVKPEVRATAIAIFLFCMNQVGGNLPVVMTPLRSALGDDYRAALGIMWPGCLALSSIIFLAASLPLACMSRDSTSSPDTNTSPDISAGSNTPLLDPRR